MKRGFTLIELLIALAIGGMVITFLFNSYFQTSQVVSRIDTAIDITTRATIIKHQLEKDIMGAFVPVQAEPEPEKDPQPPRPGQQKEPPKKPKKTLEKVFYGINKGSNLDVLTFITNNPMSAYWSKQMGKAQPKIARVVYRLVEDGKNSFKLLRQEDTDLEFNAYSDSTKIRAYEVAEGIKELKTTYIAVQKKTEDIKPTSPGKQQMVKEEKTSEKTSEWNIKKEDGKKADEQKQTIPNIVQIELSLWNSDAHERATTYEFSIPILPNFTKKPKKQKKKPEVSPEVKKLLKEHEEKKKTGGSVTGQPSRSTPGQPSGGTTTRPSGGAKK